MRQSKFLCNKFSYVFRSQQMCQRVQKLEKMSHFSRGIRRASSFKCFYKLVIFDKDGTLTCFSSMWGPWTEATVSRMEVASGKKISKDIYEFLNYDLKKQTFGKSRLAHDTHGVLKNDLADLLQNKHGFEALKAKSLVEDQWDDSFDIAGSSLAQTVKPLGDINKIFSVLKDNGIKIAVCTSDSRKSVELALSGLGILDMIDRVMCGDDSDNTAKPAPDNVQTICKELEVMPEQTAMIGDTHYDSVMGRDSNCGMIIGVLSGQGDTVDLKDSDYIVDSIDEALPLVLNQNEPIRTRNQRGKQDSDSAKNPFVGGAPSKRHYSTSAPSRKEFTYIIVGAGSAGCVVANRLTEDSCNSVLLLEAGPKDTILNSSKLSWKIHMPAALTYNLCDDKYNWFYHTIPQRHANNRIMYWPRGRVWGGSSSLNAMVYIRGHAYDYDRWEDEGAAGWDYDHCLPYFKKSQKHEHGEDAYRGGNGPLNVSQGDVSNPLNGSFLESAKQAGYLDTTDMNGYQQEGFGAMDMTIHKGYRWSTSTAYLKPALKRPNLTAKVKCLTSRIVFEGNKAVGVECIYKHQKREYRALKEVILCGGSINSPQLLMLSGVGNSDELKKLDIPVVQHLPGVGQNLQDHLEIQVQHECKKPITLYSAQKPWNMARIGLEWFYRQTGLGATSHMHTGGFIRSRAGLSHPDIQFHFFPSQYSDHGRIKPTCHAFQIHVGTLRESSRGKITLKSRNPKEHPLIDPNYLATEEDVVDMRQCIKLGREILRQQAFDKFRGEEIKPGKKVLSDSQLDSFVRATCETEYHPSSTCKMGNEFDSMAVVNSQGKVFGTESLRIVDASIMPSVVSGNLNAPTIMVAEKIADAIRGRKTLHVPNIPVYQPKSLSSQR